jgi:hypothetical protein
MSAVQSYGLFCFEKVQTYSTDIVLSVTVQEGPEEMGSFLGVALLDLPQTHALDDHEQPLVEQIMIQVQLPQASPLLSSFENEYRTNHSCKHS